MSKLLKSYTFLLPGLPGVMQCCESRITEERAKEIAEEMRRALADQKPLVLPPGMEFVPFAGAGSDSLRPRFLLLQPGEKLHFESGVLSGIEHPKVQPVQGNITRVMAAVIAISAYLFGCMLGYFTR